MIFFTYVLFVLNILTKYVYIVNVIGCSSCKRRVLRIQYHWRYGSFLHSVWCKRTWNFYISCKFLHHFLRFCLISLTTILSAVYVQVSFKYVYSYVIVILRIMATKLCYNFSINIKVVPGGIAAKSGKLRMGDRILKVNGTDVTKATHQEAVMELLRPGRSNCAYCST